jgi:long-subunit fatty acid transport protein
MANTQRTIAEGFAADPANDRMIVSGGASWKPVPQVVGKVG